MEGIVCVVFKMGKIFLNVNKSHNFSRVVDQSLFLFMFRTVFISFFQMFLKVSTIECLYKLKLNNCSPSICF